MPYNASPKQENGHRLRHGTANDRRIAHITLATPPCCPEALAHHTHYTHTLFWNRLSPGRPTPASATAAPPARQCIDVCAPSWRTQRLPTPASPAPRHSARTTL